ncbi:hypothetical protein FACS1894122_01710 [Alphaproteobacteria bacterium]|nr:hypothetical protein FACS1894122_01710 [Alphaproteobacteria bacterium]
MKKLCIVASALGLFASADLVASDVPGADELSPQDAQKATLSGFYGALGIGGNFEDSKLTANSVKYKDGAKDGAKDVPAVDDKKSPLTDVEKKAIEAEHYKDALGDFEEDDGDPDNEENGALLHAWNYIRQDEEKSGKTNGEGNIDEIFGRTVRWQNWPEETSHIVFYDPNTDDDIDPNTDEYKDEYNSLFGRNAWNAAKAINNVNEAYNGDGTFNNENFEALVSDAISALKELKWDKDQWDKMLSDTDKAHEDFKSPDEAIEWWCEEANTHCTELLQRYNTLAEEYKGAKDEIKKVIEEKGGGSATAPAPSKKDELKGAVKELNIKAVGLDKGSFLGVVAVGYGRFFNSFYVGLEGLVDFGSKADQTSKFTADEIEYTGTLKHGQVTPVISARIGYYIDTLGLLPYLKFGCAFTRTTASLANGTNELKLSKAVPELDLGIEKALTKRSSIRAEVGYRFSSSKNGDIGIDDKEHSNVSAIDSKLERKGFVARVMVSLHI